MIDNHVIHTAYTYEGMGKDVFDKFDSSKQVYEEAASVLGDHFIKVMFEGPLNELTMTEYAQPGNFYTIYIQNAV